MAQLHAKSYEFPRANGYPDAMTEEDAEMRRLQAASDALADGEIVGAVLNFPVADNYARYLVKSAKPLVLQHLPFFDGYTVPASHIRGLRSTDVEQMVRSARAWRTLAAKQDASNLQKTTAAPARR